MKREALFSDGTGNFVVPAEPKAFETVRLRFRTAKDDVDFVRVIAGADGFVMRKAYTRGEFDYYELSWELEEEPLSYCFEANCGDEVCYYNRCGVSEHIVDEYAFTIVPGFATPDWAKGAVMYQIFVDRFYNGDKSNDVSTGEYIYIDEICENVPNWNKKPAYMGVREFYGGDLQGVLDKLDYLQDLGIEVIYFNPIFVSPSNHKYDIQDYDYIDPHYGRIVKDGGQVLKDAQDTNDHATKYKLRVTHKENLEASNQLFIYLVEEMHKRGMKVILDGVFNHCGSFNKWMDRERLYEDSADYESGAYISADSPYHSFFKFAENEPCKWPYNATYEGWWGHNTLPKLNYEDSDKLEQYILSIGKKWVSPPYNVDGWRLDVAADLGHSPEYNHEFWKKFRKVVKTANPDAIIMAEHYGNPQAWLQGDEWDTVMNYDAFMEPVTWYLTGMEKHSDDYRQDLLGNVEHFIGAMKHHMTHMLTPSLMVSMNELSNHDHSRFLTRTNHMVGRVQELGHDAAEQYTNEAVMREAIVMQMTWIGAPTVYYGDEAGVVGFTDPDNRRTYPWGNENTGLIAFHKEAIRIHKESEALRYGSLEILGGRNGILAYGRFTEKDKILVVVNNSNEAVEIKAPVWRLDVPRNCVMTQLLYTYENSYSTKDGRYLVENGEVTLKMSRSSAIILQYKN